MDWVRVASKSRPGRFYFFNKKTHETSWKVPHGYGYKEPSDKENSATVNGNQNASQSVPSDSSSAAGSKTVSKAANAKGNGLAPALKLTQSAIKARTSSRGGTVKSVGFSGVVHLQTNSNNCMETAQPSLPPEEEAMEIEERWGEEEVIDMDVDMTEEEQLSLISEIHSTRSHLPLAASVESLVKQGTAALASTKLYLVLDTNILISHLGFLRDIKDYAIKSVGRPVLVVPWVVMQELDALKKSSSGRLADKARNAIRFLHDSFESQHPRVRGQTMDEVQTELKNIAISNNDDRILHCCLLYQEKVKGHGGMVILFSNDVQLCSKAMVNQVRALNRKTLLSELRVLFKNGSASVSAPPTAYPQAQESAASPAPRTVPVTREVLEDMLCEAESVVGTALSAVIYKEMVEAYGDIWESIVIVKPPWQFKDTVKIVDKHWVAVFRALLPSHIYHSSVTVLLKHVNHRDRIIPNTSTVDGFLVNSMQLLRAFADVSGYSGVLPRSVAHIATLADRLGKARSMGAMPVSIPVHQVTSHVTGPVPHVTSPGPHVPTPAGPLLSDPRSPLPSHVTTPTSHVTPPQALPLITALLRPSCDEILGLVGAIPSLPLEQLKWILDIILAISKHCHSRIMLTLQNNPDSLSDKQEARVFLTQLIEILHNTITAMRMLLTNQTTRELIRAMLLQFQIFLHTTLVKNCPLSMEGFIQSVQDSSAKVQELLVEALTSFSTMIGALNQLPNELGMAD